MLSTKEVNAVDRAGLWKAYREWPEAASRALRQPLRLPAVGHPSSIVLVGMGGSGAACDVAADWLAANSAVPVVVVKDYNLPRFVDEKSLVMLVSLSGETKEVLAMMAQALERKCPTVAISSGGELEKRCRRLGVPHNKVEKLMRPRASMPELVLVTLRVLDELGVVAINEDLEGMVSALRKRFSEVSPSRPYGDNRAKKVARALVLGRPVVYVPKSFASVGQHFQASLNENAKVPAHSGTYPDVFHNEVETWKEGFERVVVLLRYGEEEENVTKRLARTKKLLSEGRIPVYELKENSGLLASLLTASLFLDMVSIYVAILRGVAPIETPLLDGTRIL